METDRYARQVLALGEEGQRTIEAAHVGIVGLGGMGSQVAQALAYLGIGSFVLIDHDRVEVNDLNRLVGAMPADAKAHALKVAVAERMIRQINSKAAVCAIAENLRSREALEALISCPVIFGCVDSDGPRLILTELAAAYTSTLFDSATEILFQDGQLSEYGGRVVVARPGDFCLDCAQQIDMQVAKQELESSAIREMRKAHGYGLGERVAAPSVVSLNGIVANLAVTELLVMVIGIREPNRHLTYYGSRGIVNNRQDKRRGDCYICGYVVGRRQGSNIFRYVTQEA